MAAVSMAFEPSPAPSLLKAWGNSVASTLLTKVRRDHHCPDQTRVVEAYRDLLQKLLAEFQMQAGCIVFFNEDLTEFDSFVSEGYAESDSRRTWTIRPADGIVARVAATGEVDLNNSVDQEPAYKRLHSGTTAQLTVPLLDGFGHAFAVVALESEGQIPELFLRIAKHEQGEFALRVGQLRRAVLAEQLENAFALLNKIAEAEDEEESWRLVTHGVLSFIDSSSEVSILRREGGQLTHVRHAHANVPSPPHDLRIGIENGRGYTCYVGRTRKAFYCFNVRDRKRFPQYRKVVDGTLSQYTVPLLFRNDLVGVLNVGSPIIYGFPSSIRHLLDLIASHAANALHYAVLVKQFRTASHRVKNHLKLFSWVAPGLAEKLDPEGVVDMRRLIGAVNSATSLLEGLTYPLQPTEPNSLDVVPVLRRVLDEFVPLLREKSISLRHNLEHEPARSLKMDGEDLEDVFQNVMWNAVEALVQVEEPAIEVVIEHLVDRKAKISHLRVSVKDNGPGVRTDLMAESSARPAGRSTKPGGRWRGLGLWICDRILANYGGYLSLEAAEPTGTVARMYLPMKLR